MKQGWEIKKLGEVASIKSGKSIDASQISTDASLYPCYGGNGVRGFVNDYSYDGCFPIIGRVGALCGNVHLAKGKFYATEHALVVEIKSTNIDSEWLKYNLISLNLRNIAKGVAQPVIAAGEVSKILIPVPPLPEQEKIVSELDCLSGIIEKKRQQLKELDALAQSFFYEMFGNPVDNERGWEVKKLIDIYKFIDYRGKTPNKITKGIPLITAKNIRKGYIDYSVREYISEEEFLQRQSRGIAKKGDLLFTTEAPMGCVAIADLDVFSTGQRLITFQKKQSFRIDNTYVLYYLLSDTFQLELNNQATGATVKGIKGSKLEQMTIPLPPLPLQQSFAQKVEAIEKQKELIKQSIIEVETLLASRMQYYFEEG